jgi:hypothetical protein
MAKGSPVTTRRLMSRLERGFEQRFFLVFVVVAILLVGYALLTALRYGYIDWLFISTVVVFVIGMRLAMRLPGRLEQTLTRLANRGTLQISPADLDGLKQTISRRSARWAQVFGIIGIPALLFAVIVLANRFAYGGFWPSQGDLLSKLFNGGAVLLPLEAVVGYFVGYYAGYAVSNGRLGIYLKNYQVALKVQPGHPDGAAGLTPVGSLYLVQAFLVAIPTLYVGVWWVLFKNVADLRFEYGSSWMSAYALLFWVFIVVEVLAFVVPMWSFHEEMQEQKSALADEADKLSHRIVTTENKLIEAETPEEVQTLDEQLTAMKNYYRAIQRMRTWPLDISTFLQFVIPNLGLILPALTQLHIVQGFLR